MRYSVVLMTVLAAASAALAQGTGDATFYAPGLGSCGLYNTDADFIVALDVATMNAHSTGNPNTNPLCGKQIAITGPDGKTATATVVDTCPGCAVNSIDLSPAAFQQLASFDVGRLHGVSWTFVN
ncbi:RlpA-like double-psi beta-barrel-protein domain-containing protein-containing protein [Trametes elegans]|nr:RlpA-like double-psi beta-barrel-protein domain-containing protein-containing protein [Trametes elegans]